MSEHACHRSRTEGRPCVWMTAQARCTKGHVDGSSERPSCPEDVRAAPRSTEVGSSGASSVPSWVITEFEADVPWAGAQNTIACSAEHHLREGRWMRNLSVLDSYSRFWFNGQGEPRKYTFPAAAAMHERHLVTGDASLLAALYDALARNYRAWAAAAYAPRYGCAFGYADRDGQEHSIGGDGCRPLQQAALYAEASALAHIAKMRGDADGAAVFASHADRWQRATLSLWSPALRFFVTRAVARPPSMPAHAWSERQQRRARELNGGRCPPAWKLGDHVGSRELQGLSSPWHYRAVPRHNASAFTMAWTRLSAADGFAGKWAPRTAERADACYNYTAGHECAWNGYGWPFETSKVISGALSLHHHYPESATRAPGAIDAQGLWAALEQYARMHTQSSAVNASAWLLPGNGQAWIGEMIHPDEGEWWTRKLLYEAHRADRNRGGRYLHSTFVDLIAGLLGLWPRDPRSLSVRVLLPDTVGVRFFALDGVLFRGRDLCVAYDRDGSRYGLGVGVHVLVDGHLHASGGLGESIAVAL